MLSQHADMTTVFGVFQQRVTRDVISVLALRRTIGVRHIHAGLFTALALRPPTLA